MVLCIGRGKDDSPDALANEIERICDLLSKSPAGLGQTVEEAKVCSVLCELGEATATTVARFAGVSYSKALSILIDLQERGVTFSFGTVPKIFALTREEIGGARKEN